MNARFIVKSLKGCAVGIAVSLILTLVLSVIAVKTPDPAKLIGIMAHFARFGGAFATGFAAARMNREKGLVCGITGGTVFSCFMIIGAACSDGAFKFVSVLVACLACILLSAVGGITGIPKEKSGLAKRRELIRKKGL